MDPEIKAQWVAALRSGEYEQGDSVLKSPSGRYCCLGVLCDLVDPDGWGDGGFTFGGETGNAYLPDVLVRIHGISPGGDLEIPGGVASEHGCMSLSLLNDRGFTFDQIADIIDYFF